jgi:hypothetical protein
VGIGRELTARGISTARSNLTGGRAPAAVSGEASIKRTISPRQPGENQAGVAGAASERSWAHLVYIRLYLRQRTAKRYAQIERMNGLREEKRSGQASQIPHRGARLVSQVAQFQVREATEARRIENGLSTLDWVGESEIESYAGYDPMLLGQLYEVAERLRSRAWRLFYEHRQTSFNRKRSSRGMNVRRTRHDYQIHLPGPDHLSDFGIHMVYAANARKSRSAAWS